jgi:RND superfamily putative drug exporter
VPLSVTLESVVSMLGLGLGLDYALLTVRRFGEARGEGCSVQAAAEEAGRQAGATVLVSGTAVAIGFVGLLLVPLSDVRSIAVGGLLVTGAAVLLATTLLPALLAMLGHRLRAGQRGGGPAMDRSHRAWRRWGAWVAAHPIGVLLVAGAPLVGLAVAAHRMQTGLPEDDWLPAPMDSAAAIRDLRAMGRVGVVQTIRVVLELPEEATALSREGWTGTKRLAAALRADARVAAVRSLRDFAGEQADDLAFVSLLPGFVKHAFVSSLGDAVLLEIVPGEAVGSDGAAGLVRDLRRMDAAARTGLAGARLAVGGLPAFNADYSDALARAWFRVLAVVLFGSLLVLAVGFRSLLVPLKAVGLNLLSVAAALGAVVLVFQDGRATGLGLTVARGPVFPAVPLLVFGIVFGLSLDYEVFLMARVREARRAGLGEEQAVAEGLARTGGVITSAGAIMVAVFAAFTLADNRLLEMLGFALATAVLLDATLVRVAVGPALLRLLGRWNWWPGMGRSDPPPAV